jgi:digeranylgeranylglycerophospholipid reductase
MTGTREYDILVVGAGPAGSMAAKAAAEQGRRVCLAERLVRPGIPARCGEGIGRKGASISLTLRKEWIRATIRAARFYSPSGTTVEVRSVAESYILDREKMDADLAEEAKAAGADLRTRTPIVAVALRNGWYEASSPDLQVRARCIICADGVESRIARDLGWNTALRLSDMESCAFARVTHESVDQSLVEFHVGTNIAPGGYAWVFPRGNCEANVGLGVMGLRHDAGKAREHLRAFIARRFPGASAGGFHCGGVPVGRFLRPLVREGAMLVGDAARQVGAINGAGIAYALFAGKTAGTAAARAFSGGAFDGRRLKEYGRIWARRFGRHLDRSWRLKELAVRFSDGYLDSVAAALSKEDPARLNYARVFFKAFAGHPLLLLKAFRLFA